MPAFAVMEPPGPADAAAPVDRYVFLPEKFNIWAFLFAPLWLIAHRLWLELLVYLAALAVILGGLWAIGAGAAAAVVHILLNYLVGLEASSIRRFMLKRHGWQDAGVVVADDLDLAERRFFDDVFARRARTGAAGAAGAAVSSLPQLPLASHGSGVTGLFPEPGGGR